ncbi:short-chain dehydrogenase [Plectosphaerella plurivora]|uniref:Short-chain dehydrogenase n=1 Tax=Plectosphaerella plurivora TaxID=936078 RepID=A0A9P8V845_9PEZI|nr:short-chain dehydrogenase [Plectosphaerella plurivora]
MSPALRSTSKLQGKRVLVFGGSSGVGFSVAEAALEHGVDVIISSSNQSRLDKAVDRLVAGLESTASDSSSRISSVVCNLGDVASLKENLRAALESATVGRTRLLDHVVFTAGSPINIRPLPEMTAEAISETYFVRAIAPAVLAGLLADYIHQSVASSLTLTGGVNTHRPAPGWAPLASVGAAVEGLARGLAVDLKPLRVNVVCLGAIHTELFSAFGADQLPAALEGFKKQSLTNTVGQPEEAAETYLYLMKNTFVTGATEIVDGGLMVVR